MAQHVGSNTSERDIGENFVPVSSIVPAKTGPAAPNEELIKADRDGVVSRFQGGSFVAMNLTTEML
jgi:hypothetical protein